MLQPASGDGDGTPELLEVNMDMILCDGKANGQRQEDVLRKQAKQRVKFTLGKISNGLIKHHSLLIYLNN